MSNFSISEDVFVVQGCFYIVINEECRIYTTKGNFPILHWRSEYITEYDENLKIRLFIQELELTDIDYCTTIRIWKEEHPTDHEFGESGNYKIPDFFINDSCYKSLLDFLDERCFDARIFERYDN